MFPLYMTVMGDICLWQTCGRCAVCLSCKAWTLICMLCSFYNYCFFNLGSPWASRTSRTTRTKGYSLFICFSAVTYNARKPTVLSICVFNQPKKNARKPKSVIELGRRKKRNWAKRRGILERKTRSQGREMGIKFRKGHWKKQKTLNKRKTDSTEIISKKALTVDYEKDMFSVEKD